MSTETVKKHEQEQEQEQVKWLHRKEAVVSII
jgi:hypothetical protein